MYDVNLFLGTAAAMIGNRHDYPVGERHALLVFLRQLKGTEADWTLAESHVANARWSDIELQKASVIAADALDSQPEARPSYEHAMTEGWAIIVFADPI